MRKALLVTLFGCACLSPLKAQAPAAPKVDKASAYYHYTLAHMFAEQASMVGNRGDFVNKAIENYKEAIKADPTAAMLSEELSDLYVQSGRLRDAQTDAEETLKLYPNDLNAHRLLARIFTRLIGDGKSGKIDENMLRRAVEQYQKITTLAPKDLSAWLMLARLYKASDNSVDSEKAYQKVLAIEPDNDDALTGLALVFSDLGDNKKAAELLKSAADKNPSARSLAALAAAYEQMRDFKSAAEVLSKELENNPPNEREVQRNIAQDLLLSLDYAGALKIYSDMVTEDPNDSQSILRISQIYRQQKDFAKAREANDQAKALDANSVEVRYNEVNILEAEDRTQEAAQQLKELLASTVKRTYNQAERTNRVALLNHLATLYRSMDQTGPAVDAYRQMAEVNPELAAQSQAEVIEAYRAGKDFTKAQQEADAAIKKWPDDRTIRVVRASMLAEMGKVDEAAADLRKLLGGKEDRETYLALAQVYDKGKRWDDMGKALDAAEKISESTDEKVNVWFTRGAMLERMKKLDLAEEQFRKVLDVDPDNAGAMNYIGYMLADANLRLDESFQLVTKALEREPGNGAYLDSLGWVEYRLGRLEDAEKNLRRALEKTPRDPTVHDHMADVLIKQSKVREAVAQWEVSLKQWDASSPAETEPAEIAQVRKKLEAARVRLAKEVAR